MNSHLSSQEFVNALDDALTAAQRSHLDGCPHCQAEVAELRALSEEAAAGRDVPEPSPLFWDHFHARVMAAAEATAAPQPRAWWRIWVDARTMVAVGAGALAIATGAALSVSRSAGPEPATQVKDAATAETGTLADAAADFDADEWEFVASVMGTLEGDDIHEVLTPSGHAVDAAMESLTSAERDRFAKLLAAELAEGSN